MSRPPSAMFLFAAALMFPGSASADAASDNPDARLLAGVREYPAAALRALIELADDPLVIRQLAEEPQKLADPSQVYPPVSDRTRAAIVELQNLPELVALGAAYPEQVSALRERYLRDPQAVEARLAALRAGYHEAQVRAAAAWETLLRERPEAQEAYARLVTRFCREQLRDFEQFPYVVVRDPAYYAACPPNEMIAVLAEQADTPAALRDVLAVWWQVHAPERIDERVINGEIAPAPSSVQTAVAAQPPQQRAAMWRPPKDQGAEAAAMVPVIMQPPGDQPADALLAFAISEHARLWAAPVRVDEGPSYADVEAATPIVVREDVAVRAPLSAGSYEERPWSEVLIDNVAPGVASGPVIVIDEDDLDDLEDELDDLEDELEELNDLERSRAVYAALYPPVVQTRIYATRPYYSCYPWTWPVVCQTYPVYRPGCRSTLGFGTSAYVTYHGTRVQAGFRIGHGARLAYRCPTPRRVVHRRHVIHRSGRHVYVRPYNTFYRSHGERHVRRPHGNPYYRNYGAPYGGPYWQNYGAPYGRRAGDPRFFRDYDRGHYGAVVRRPSRSPQGTTIRRPTRSYAGRTYRVPATRSGSRSTRSGATEIRRPARTSRRSGANLRRPGSTTILRPRRNLRGRPDSTTLRRPTRDIRIGPSHTGRSPRTIIRRGGTATPRVRRDSRAIPPRLRQGMTTIRRPSQPTMRRPRGPLRSDGVTIRRPSAGRQPRRTIRRPASTPRPGATILRRPGRTGGDVLRRPARPSSGSRTGVIRRPARSTRGSRGAEIRRPTRAPGRSGGTTIRRPARPGGSRSGIHSGSHRIGGRRSSGAVRQPRSTPVRRSGVRSSGVRRNR